MYVDDTVFLLGYETTEAIEIGSLISINMAIEYCHNHILVHPLSIVVNEEKANH